MADSITPHAIPATYSAKRNRGVAPYIDGNYAWPRGVIRSYPRHLLGIDVTGAHPEAADVLDSELFDATPDDWPKWRHDRDELVRQGKTRGWPKVYCSIDPGDGYGVAAIVAATAAANQQPVERWWIAWYTPGQYAPTQTQVLAQVRALTNITLPLGSIWGCQYAADVPGVGGSYDLSVIYEDPEWQ